MLMFLFTFNNFSVVFSVIKEIQGLEFLNSFVMSLVCFSTYVNLAHFVGICSSCNLVLFHSFFEYFIQNCIIRLVMACNFFLLCIFNLQNTLWDRLINGWSNI